ncbi:hypothetical protein [Sphingomonas sp. GC_Shp_3]|jgi:hypothetical protein|uniref:hypothetical protein n=1 Tax=Sphingomonas sp. GC_Shp_3 TaxID=2937383 RepID=UPI002269DC81|nr:hypothetical protein [Sphingomonas sp. GC_Shp_3]
MYEGPIVAAYELQATQDTQADNSVRRGPIAGIVAALPISLALWVGLYCLARLWF